MELKCPKVATREYRKLHEVIEKLFGKPKWCEVCGTLQKRVYNWHNKTGLNDFKRENWLRVCVPCHRNIHNKGKCKKGHDLNNPDNVWIRPSGKRVCKVCSTNRLKNWRKEKYESEARENA